jgi:hypothetical protein
MKRVAVLIAVVVASLIPAAPAAAARGVAGDFAADCNDDGIVTVSGVQKYVGGSGTIVGDCIVGLDTGATLVFRDVELSGTGNLVAISSPDHTTLKVIGSVIKVAGALELTAGCCAGDQLVPENDGTVIVKNSTLAGDSLQLIASFDWPSGKVVVRNSTLEGSGRLGVQVRASNLAGSDGVVRVLDSSITSGGDVWIATGTDGLTVARRDTFSAAGAVTISTGTGGSCRSSGHTPPTACT